MTEKRFIEPYKDCRVIKNIQTGETATYYDKEDGLTFLKWLNNLSDENEQLKARIEYLERKIQRERKSNIVQNEKWEKEATDLIREQRKFIDDLNKENEQLKQQCKDFMEMLDDMCIAYLVNDGLEEILND